MNRRALAIGVGAAVAVLLVWYLLFWRPRNRALDQAEQRRQAAEQQESQLRTEIARLRAAQAQEPARRARLEALRAAIPDEPNLAQFILDANEAAVRSGIDFVSITPGLPSSAQTGGGAGAAAGTAPPAPPPSAAASGGAPTGPPAQVSLDLQIGGGYFQVLDFLNRLDALPRLVVTDGLTITSDDKAKLSVAVEARMFVRTLPPGYGAAGPGTTATAPRPSPAPASASATPASSAGGPA